MDSDLQIKITNIINEINNQLNKDFIDTSVSKNLMQFAVSRMNLLLTHIGYLESKIQLDYNPSSNINNVVGTCTVDQDWNLDLSHGEEANYLFNGQAIKTLIDHINYLHVLIENCPGNKNER